MTLVLPPQGFRHAVELLLKQGARDLHHDPEQLARELVALGEDMNAPAEFGAWVMAEYERLLQTAAPATLTRFGRKSAGEPAHDLFLIYVPEDRLPLAAPLAVELAKRRISVAFAGYEVDSGPQLTAAIARGLRLHRAGAVLKTPAFLRRNLPEPEADTRLQMLKPSTRATAEAERLIEWLSRIHTTNRSPRG